MPNHCTVRRVKGFVKALLALLECEERRVKIHDCYFQSKFLTTLVGNNHSTNRMKFILSVHQLTFFDEGQDQLVQI